MKAVSAADANRHFAAILREVAQGKEVMVTSRGKPVAKLVPLAAGNAGRAAARKTLFARLKRRKSSNAPRNWTRNELYD